MTTTRRRATCRPRSKQTLVVLAILLAGCRESTPPPLTSALPPAPTEDELRQELDATLQATFERQLNLRDHAAWQILHGVLAFGSEFQVGRDHGGQAVGAVEHLLSGGEMKGWTIEPGIVLDADADRRGLRAVVEAGSKTGQGHHDQWFAVLAQAGLTPDTAIVCDDRRLTIEDWVGQVKWDLPRNLNHEFSWTLIGLTSYLPTDAVWEAEDGGRWSIERLLELELEHELASSACGGSHRLIGIAMALNRHLAQQRELSGVWEHADRRVQQALATAEEFQNPDGSFSVNYFQRPGASPDLAEDLGATGHTFEFITLAATDEQLQQAWVSRAARHLCDLLQRTEQLPLECGALYHAAHGLVLYRQRLFGEFQPQQAVVSPSAN